MNQNHLQTIFLVDANVNLMVENVIQNKKWNSDNYHCK